MSNTDPDPDLAALATLLQMLEHASFRRAFVSNPQAALTQHDVGGVGQHLLNVLAELSYEELSLIGHVGSELRAMLGAGAGGFMF